MSQSSTFLKVIISCFFALAFKPIYAQISIDDNHTYLDLSSQALRTMAADGAALNSINLQMDQWLDAEDIDWVPKGNTIWSKVTVEHQGIKELSLTLNLSTVFTQSMVAYVLDQNSSIHELYRKPIGPESKRHFTFTIRPNETFTIYVGTVTDGFNYAPLELWSTDRFNAYHQAHHQYQWMLEGALACLFIYFLVTYFLQRNPARFWFAAFTVATLHALFVVRTEYYAFANSWLTLTEFVEVSICLVLFAAIRTQHYLFQAHIKAYRYVQYGLCLVALGLLLVFEISQIQQWLLVLLLFASLLMQIFGAFLYADREHPKPALFFASGWVLIALISIGLFSAFASDHALSPLISNAIYALLAVSCILIGISIEIAERELRLRTFSQQEQQIQNLHQFYDMFKTSVEGLYTSTLEGQLLSVNPAMSHLFGFPDEKTMLQEVKSTKDFYARIEDRKLLVDEIMSHGQLTGREIKGKKRDGSEFWFSISCQMHGEENNQCLYGSIFDITERKQSNMSLEYLATHDSLTGLLNRREFERQLHLAEQLEQACENISVLYLNLDRFKLVNDSCGHHAGDELIRDIANLIHELVGTKGQVGRIGGDEFAILLVNIDEDTSYLCANKLLKSIQDFKFFYENRMFTLGVSIGFLYTEEKTIPNEQLLSMADAACHIAKEQGRNRIHRYSANDTSLKRYESEIGWLNRINDALQNDKFVLYYQNYEPLNSDFQGLHAEILVRLRDDEGLPILPSLFLPTAERYNLGHRIDQWVIENTFRYLASHPDVLKQYQKLNINLSGQSLASQELKVAALNAFVDFDIPYDKICFEITETTAIVRLEEALDFINTFRQLGCSFVLDDFGSGFSSYNYLKTLPVDCVKIDGSFIRELLDDQVSRSMVASMNDVAKTMQMQTVAEFVEGPDTLTQLGSMGIDFAQGYGVAKPLPLSELTLKQ